MGASEKQLQAASVAHCYVNFLQRLGVTQTSALGQFLRLFYQGSSEQSIFWNQFCRLLTPERQGNAIKAVARRANLDRTALAFLDFVIQEKRVWVLGRLYGVWIETISETVKVEVASPLNNQTESALQRQIHGVWRTQKSDKLPNVCADEKNDLLAGYRLYQGTQRVDASLKTMLERFKRDVLSGLGERRQKGRMKRSK